MLGRCAFVIVLGTSCGTSTRVESTSPVENTEKVEQNKGRGLADAAVFGKGASDEAMAGLVDRAVGAAKLGAPETFAFEVRTSSGFGCSCPPFHIGTSTFVMPRFSTGLPDPEDTWFSTASYRFWGHFDGRRISAIEWRKEAGKPHVPGEMDDGWEEPSPALVVDDWCLVPERPFFRNEASDEDVVRIQQRLCAGAVVAFQDATD